MEKKTILIVDDEPVFVEALRRILQERSCRVIAGFSPEEVPELMKNNPQVVLLGTVSPAGGAFAVHRWIRQSPRYREIPIFIIDAPQGERKEKGWRVHEGMQMEAEDYETKPVEPSLLVPRIERLMEKAMQKIRVLTVDDHTMVRDGLTAVLSLQKDIVLVGEAVTGLEAIEKAVHLMPDVVLMDIMMPGMNGLEATRQIHREHPEIKVLILTQYDDEENMEVAKKTGALGFIPKKAASAELLSGIRTVSEGRYYPDLFAAIAT